MITKETNNGLEEETIDLFFLPSVGYIIRELDSSDGYKFSQYGKQVSKIVNLDPRGLRSIKVDRFLSLIEEGSTDWELYVNRGNGSKDYIRGSTREDKLRLQSLINELIKSDFLFPVTFRRDFKVSNKGKIESCRQKIWLPSETMGCGFNQEVLNLINSILKI